MVKQSKSQLEAEKDKKYILNRMYVQIKKNDGYFKDTNGKFIEYQKGFCDGCEMNNVRVRALEADPHKSDHICPSCACDFQLCRLLILMKNGK